MKRQTRPRTATTPAQPAPPASPVDPLEACRQPDGSIVIRLDNVAAMQALRERFETVGGEWRYPFQPRPVLYVVPRSE